MYSQILFVAASLGLGSCLSNSKIADSKEISWSPNQYGPPLIFGDGEFVPIEAIFNDLVAQHNLTADNTFSFTQSPNMTLYNSNNGFYDVSIAEKVLLKSSHDGKTGPLSFNAITTELAADKPEMKIKKITCKESQKTYFAGCWEKAGDCTEERKFFGTQTHAVVKRCYDPVDKFDDSSEEQTFIKQAMDNKTPCYELKSDVFCPMGSGHISPYARFWFMTITGMCQIEYDYNGIAITSGWKIGQYDVPVGVTQLGCRMDKDGNKSCKDAKGTRCCSGDCQSEIVGF